MDGVLDLIILFTASFLAATLFPAQSEIILTSIYLSGKYPALTLLIIATVGNVLGSLVNWFIGYYLIHFKDRKWFPVTGKSLERATTSYEKWGVWTLLFAWVPIIGDAFTLVAGLFRTNIWLFIILVTIGKAARYMALLAILK
jgi:membrane protein YqaA with SNARE-associated domain